MATDDERREVAARLRDIGEKICYTSRDVLRAIQDACGCNVGLDWEDMEELRDRLADLIEPEPERTCKFIPFIEDDGSVFIENCSECDAAVLSRCEFNYCPNCGARVTEVVS